MPTVLEDNISASFGLPRFLEREKSVLVNMPIYSDGVLVVPTSGTYTLLDENRDTIINAQAVTITASVATYEVTAAVLDSTVGLTEFAEELWLLTLTSGEIVKVYRTVHIVLRSIVPTVTILDLYKRHSDLNPTAAASIVASTATHQDQIDASFEAVEARLLRNGSRPYLILDSWTLHEAHLYLCLSFIFRDLSLGGDSKWSDLADYYETKYNSSWGEITFRYDTANTGSQTAAEKVTAAPVIFLSRRPKISWGNY